MSGYGRADYLNFESLGSADLRVALSDSGNFTHPEIWLQHGESSPNQVQYADVNGDGKADALYFDTLRSGGVWVSLSSGSGCTVLDA